MRGLPAPRILLPVVVVEAGLLDALVTARALDEVVAALNAGSSVFLIGWLVGLRGFSPALGALGGFFCHKAKVTESEKKSRKKFDKSRPSHYDPTLTSLSLFRRSTLLENEPLVLSKICADVGQPTCRHEALCGLVYVLVFISCIHTTTHLEKHKRFFLFFFENFFMLFCLTFFPAYDSICTYS